MVLASCANDEPHIARVTFHTVCDNCFVESSGGGGQVHGEGQWEAMREVGDEVFITARPTNISDTATAIWMKVDGFQQDFVFTNCMDSAGLRSVEIRLAVPELDKYGVPH